MRMIGSHHCNSRVRGTQRGTRRGDVVVVRGKLLAALDEPPTDALAELRGVLLAEHEWRVREGSSKPC
jgi:hypothetical protein